MYHVKVQIHRVREAVEESVHFKMRIFLETIFVTLLVFSVINSRKYLERLRIVPELVSSEEAHLILK